MSLEKRAVIRRQSGDLVRRSDQLIERGLAALSEVGSTILDLQCSNSDLIRMLDALFDLVNPYSELDADDEPDPFLEYAVIEALSNRVLIRAANSSSLAAEIRISAGVRTEGYVTLDLEQLGELVAAVRACDGEGTVLRASYLPAVASPFPMSNAEHDMVPRSQRDVELQLALNRESSAAAGDQDLIQETFSHYIREWVHQADSRLEVLSDGQVHRIDARSRREPTVSYSAGIEPAECVWGPPSEWLLPGSEFARLVQQTNMRTDNPLPRLKYRFVELEPESVAVTATEGFTLLRAASEIDAGTMLEACPMLIAGDLGKLARHLNPDELVRIRTASDNDKLVISCASLETVLRRYDWYPEPLPNASPFGNDYVDTRKFLPQMVLREREIDAAELTRRILAITEEDERKPILLRFDEDPAVVLSGPCMFPLRVNSRYLTFQSYLLLRVLDHIPEQAMIIQDCVSTTVNDTEGRVLVMRPKSNPDGWLGMIMPRKFTVSDETIDGFKVALDMV